MDTNPQPSTNPQDLAEVYGFNILVRLNIPVNPSEAPALTFPASNRIGTIVLTALLKQMMQISGADVEQCCGGLELNRSVYLVQCGNTQAGLNGVKQGLDAVQLLGFSKVAWFDARERVFRLWWPTGGGVLPMPTVEELAIEVARQEEITRWMQDNEPHVNQEGGEK